MRSFLLQSLLLPFAMFAALTIGCGQSQKKPSTPAGHSHADHAGHDHDAPAGHTHEHTVNGWCVEHGVPEDKCSQCSKSAAEEFKKNNDWCAEHNRAESQCFVCSPDAEKRFAAQYKAQTGEDLPKPHKH